MMDWVVETFYFCATTTTTTTLGWHCIIAHVSKNKKTYFSLVVWPPAAAAAFFLGKKKKITHTHTRLSPTRLPCWHQLFEKTLFFTTHETKQNKTNHIFLFFVFENSTAPTLHPI
jgi:hypothetical protein